MKKIIAVLLSVFIFDSFVFSQKNLSDTMKDESRTTNSASLGFAEEEFRRGVQSFYRGAYNESILEFEKALSYLPGETRILDWLGKAYYKAGIEGAALQQWNYAKDAGYGGLLLQNKIEIVSTRRITDDYYGMTQRYTESGSFPNIVGKEMIYSQPVSSLANLDGSIWVIGYGSNELVKFDVNGFAVTRSKGPVNGFDRPMDLIRLSNGNIAVTESAGDRVAILDDYGKFIKYYGSKGRGVGQFVGPQYLAEDEFGNIYVTDFGNARIVVFDSEGNGLMCFGNKTPDFSGFKSPTGIAVIDGRIFVADSVKGGIYEFDKAGNYLGILVNDKTFARPEGLKNYGGYLLLTDKNKVYTVDISDGSVYENAITGKGKSQITSAVPDRNGNIIVTDFTANEVYVMSKMTELVGGLFVQFERIISDNFPEILAEVKVENRKRQPVVGLKQKNFLITEGKRPVANFELIGSANNNDVVDIILIIDRSESMRGFEEQLTSAVKELSGAMNGKGTISIISAGEIPVTEYKGTPEKLSDFSVKALKSQYSDTTALDLAVRLASNNLINAEKKRGIIYLSSGEVTQNAFTKYSLSDLTTFMNNNTISFSTVLLNQHSPSKEISYITDTTKGKSYYIYRPEGLSGVIKDILDIPSGVYQFKYTSSHAIEYGKKYLPIEIETYLLNRSGRDETGYFAPLQ